MLIKSRTTYQRLTSHCRHTHHTHHSIIANKRLLLTLERRSISSNTSNSTPSTTAVNCKDSTTTFQKHLSALDAKRPPIYVTATRQHVGKTSVSLALFSGLRKRFQPMGFIKAVGQSSMPVTEKILDGNKSDKNNAAENNKPKTIQVDKDVVLMAQYFGLDEHLHYRDMSPLLIPPGYTRDYCDNKIDPSLQRNKIMKAYNNIASQSSLVLCEGTGHSGVGSIIEANNAQVASWLGAHVILVANGGLGHTFDELALNRAMLQQENKDMPILGVIVNKVQQTKYEQTKYYLHKILQERWDVPLLGCVPDRQFLGCPALADLERIFPGAQIVSGQKHRLRHYTIHDLEMVATSLHVFLKKMRKAKHSRTLFVCHASRNDILLGFLMESQIQGGDWGSALLVTGCDSFAVSAQVYEIAAGMPNAPPVIFLPYPTRHVMELIHVYTPKLNVEDKHRVEITVAHYEPYIDFDLLIQRMHKLSGKEIHPNVNTEIDDIDNDGAEFSSSIDSDSVAAATAANKSALDIV